jgi:hypothetical protein
MPFSIHMNTYSNMQLMSEKFCLQTPRKKLQFFWGRWNRLGIFFAMNRQIENWRFFSIHIRWGFCIKFYFLTWAWCLKLIEQLKAGEFRWKEIKSDVIISQCLRELLSWWNKEGKNQCSFLDQSQCHQFQTCKSKFISQFTRTQNSQNEWWSLNSFFSYVIFSCLHKALIS